MYICKYISLIQNLFRIIILNRDVDEVFIIDYTKNINNKVIVSDDHFVMYFKDSYFENVKTIGDIYFGNVIIENCKY